MKKLVTLALLSVLVAGCANNTTLRMTPQATGGSKADGTITLAYEVAAGQNVIVDWDAAEKNALKRCQAWGYSRVDAFAGVVTQCTEVGRGYLINGAYPGACARQLVQKNYQCLN